MFSKVLDFTENILFTLCTKQLSQSERSLNLFGKLITTYTRSYSADKYLSLYMNKSTFPFITDFDLTCITREDLAFKAMNMVDYIKKLIIPKSNTRLNEINVYNEIHKIITKHQNTIEVLKIDLLTFYILNFSDAKLINCKSINITGFTHDSLPEDTANSFIKILSDNFQINVTKENLEKVVLNKYFRNLERIEHDTVGFSNPINSVLINHPLDKLKEISIEYKTHYAPSKDCVNIKIDICDFLQILPSLESSLYSISNFESTYFPNLRMIKFNNFFALEYGNNPVLIDPKMVPNLEELYLDNPLENMFGNNEELFTNLKVLSVFYNEMKDWKKHKKARMTVPDLLRSISKIHSMVSFEAYGYMENYELKDPDDMSINPSVKTISINSRKYIVKHKKILRETFPNLARLEIRSMSEEILYINDLIYEPLSEFFDTKKIYLESGDILIDEPKFEPFEEIHVYSKPDSKNILEMNSIENKKLFINIGIKLDLDLSKYTPKYKELTFYDISGYRNSAVGNIIDVKYDEYEKVEEFLKTIKTSLTIVVIDLGDKTARIVLKNKNFNGNIVKTY